MKIFIKTTFGKTLTLEVESYHTIIELKEKIKDQTDIPLQEQLLVYMAEVLKDGETIETSKINDGLTIYLVPKK